MTIDGEQNGHLWNVLITGHGVLDDVITNPLSIVR